MRTQMQQRIRLVAKAVPMIWITALFAFLQPYMSAAQTRSAPADPLTRKSYEAQLDNMLSQSTFKIQSIGLPGQPPSLGVVFSEVLNCLSVAQVQGKTTEEPAKEDSLDSLTRRYMWATIVGVIGAWIGLAVLIYQTIITRRTSQRQLRAYVLSDSGTIANVANPVPLFPGQNLPQTEARITNTAAGPGAWIQIKNTGQTPAFKVMHWGYICFRECPLTAALPARLPTVGNFPTSILGPGMIATKLLELNPPLTPAQITDLRNGTGAVYVYGEITYVDAFGENRLTKYRVMYHRVGGAIGVSTNLTFCDEGNDAN